MNLDLYVSQVRAARDFIQSRVPYACDIAIVLGTGLGGFDSLLEDTIAINTSDIPHYPVSTAPSHAGRIIAGRLGDKHVLCISGRLHYYEGYEMWDVTFPIRLIGELNISKLIITNASGGTNENYDAGDFVFIRDHINLFPSNPLRGQNHEDWGPRFPDMSQAYSPAGLAEAKRICIQLEIEFKQGTYVGFPGPNLETPAEYQFLHHIGGDMVGMSTVPEVLVARHMGIDIVGISLVTNACYPPERVKETTVEEVIAMAQSRGPEFQKLIFNIVESCW